MRWSLYKKFFSVDFCYQKNSATGSTNLMVIPAASTIDLMRNCHLGYRTYEGGILVHFEGTQDQNDSEMIIPCFVSEGPLALFFKFFITDPVLKKNLNFFPDAGHEKYGFPLLFLGQKNDASMVSTMLAYQPVEYKPARFYHHIKAVEASLPANCGACCEVKDVFGKTVYKSAVTKTITGDFDFWIDLSALPPDMYSLTAGSKNVTFFVDTGSEFQDCCAVVKIIKNEFLPFNTHWNKVDEGTDYLKFSKTIYQK
ncbi:MAG TPA: hypothetical protein PLT47_03815 [Bacteroidales bacterium]|nr:hypothetical protein [Bacteroidales bacterium]HQI69849.1 hypothetical protein [Bacteroidales bacterium]